MKRPTLNQKADVTAAVAALDAYCALALAFVYATGGPWLCALFACLSLLGVVVTARYSASLRQAAAEASE